MTLPARSGTIELIDKGSSSDTHPTPLLFVHGGWHGAWCWDEHFLDFFAGAGYRAIALSVRGHGNSPATKPLSSCSVADYVQDVRSVADGLPTPPVLIGHSMGGFIAAEAVIAGPPRFNRLVLVSAAGIINTWNPEERAVATAWSWKRYWRRVLSGFCSTWKAVD